MTSHEFDAYLDMQPLEDPPYHEQLLIMQQFDATREATLKEQSAIDALERLRNRLAFFLNEYEKLYLEDASISNFSAKLAHQTAIETLDCELENHKRWLIQVKGGVL